MKNQNVVNFTTLQEKSKQSKDAPAWLCGHVFAMIPRLIGTDKRLRRIEIVTLIAIASHSDNNGKSWASLETLSGETGYPTVKVSLAIRNLISFGYIQRTRRGPDKNNNNQTNLYFIGFESLEKFDVTDCSEKDLTYGVKLEDANLTNGVKLENSDLTPSVSSDLTYGVKQTYQEHTNKEKKENIEKKEKTFCEAAASPLPLFGETEPASLIPEDEKRDKEQETRERIIKVFERYNEITGQKRRPYKDDGKTLTPAGKMVKKRLVDEGHNGKYLLRVVRLKNKQWRDNPKDRKFLRPTTLFNEKNFDDFLDEANEAYDKGEL